MYPELMVIPMREELTRLGIQELKTTGDVDRELGIQQGTAMVIVNSICGCAASRMRPAVRIAPDRTLPDIGLHRPRLRFSGKGSWSICWNVATSSTATPPTSPPS